MIKFYQEFPDFEKVATLSQQLTWSHFVEILPIQDELKRDFYAAMCMQENWSVRTLRERKKSMLYERTAISKKPEETIKNEIAELRSEVVVVKCGKKIRRIYFPKICRKNVVKSKNLLFKQA